MLNEFVKKRVLLVGIFPDSASVRWISAPYVLKAYFEKNSSIAESIQIEVIDVSVIESIDKILQLIFDYQPEIIGFSCYTWNISIIRKLTLKLREISASTKIILGGPDISLLNANEYLANSLASADYCVIGEGEEAFLKLLEEIFLSLSVNPNKIRKSKRVNLTELPSIYLTETVPEKNYRGRLVFLETQRGCKYKCSYCNYHKNLTGITFFPIEQIKQEITYLLTEKSVTFVRIVDATFTSDLPRAKEILKHFLHLKAKGFAIYALFFEYDIHDTDEEFLCLVSQLKHSTSIYNYGNANLPINKQIGDTFFILNGYAVFNGVGIQSFNKESLKAVHRRPVTKENIEKFLDLAKKYNIILKLDMILGLPYETLNMYISGMNRLLNYIKNTDHYLQLSFLQILPNSSLENSCNTFGLYYNKDTKFVYCSDSMSESEMLYCAKITILISRIMNSSLRSQFYSTAKSTTKTVELINLIENIYQRTCEKYTEFEKISTIEAAYEYHFRSFVQIPQSFLEDCLNAEYGQ